MGECTSSQKSRCQQSLSKRLSRVRIAQVLLLKFTGGRENMNCILRACRPVNIRSYSFPFRASGGNCRMKLLATTK